METKDIISQAGKLDWCWRHGNVKGTKDAIRSIRRLLTMVEKDLPTNEATE